MATQFDRHGLPSPVASAASPAPSNGSSSRGRLGLPNARRQPLKPGSPKEIALINYIDDRMLKMTRRYGKKFTEPDSDKDDAPGYTCMDQVIIDLEPLIDLAWASGTPTVQIPYLLTFAGTIMSYMPAFPFSTQVFRIAKKLDIAFASLLRGTSGDAIRAHPVSTTEKVRIKSLVDESKMIAVHMATADGIATDIEDTEDESEDDADTEDMEDVEDDQDVSIALSISRMYKSTIEILGDTLVQ